MDSELNKNRKIFITMNENGILRMKLKDADNEFKRNPKIVMAAVKQNWKLDVLFISAIILMIE